MKSLLDKYGPWALVTGASSGIGEAFARQLSQRGLNLVLVARSENRLSALADELSQQHGNEVRIVAADLSQDDFLRHVQAATNDIEVGLLVNNAGTATSGTFLDSDFDDELNMLHLNSRAPVMLTHEFGNRMRALGRGGIIFVSSVLAFSGVPSWSHYAATKSYDLILAEGLAREMRRDEITVMAVAPGPTRTPFWNGGSSGPVPMSTPDSVARLSLRKLGKRTTVSVGLVNSLVAFSTRLLPRSWNARIFSIVVSMMKRGDAHAQPKAIAARKTALA